MTNSAEEDGVPKTSFSDNFFETPNVLTRSCSSSHTPVDGNLINRINANDWIIYVNELQELNALSVPLSILKSLEEQNSGQFCQLILDTKASDSTSRFYEGDSGLLRHQNPLTPELQ